ncbi:MAG: hypothetical protein KF868_13860 [Acidobacteria bacterium]|nr:hypothetical protein [Acidobacteriota bacterium]
MSLTGINKTWRGCTLRYGLVRLAVVCVLIVHQAGAGIVCICSEENLESRAGLQVERPSEPPVHSCHAEPDQEEAVAEDAVSPSSVQEQPGIQIRIAPPCCTLLTQPEHQATAAGEAISLRTLHSPTVAFEANALSSTRLPDRNLCPQHSRPLYLTQSCYLI